MPEVIGTPVDALTREEIEKAVIGRASEDAEFRRALLADPKSALSAMFSVPIPAGVEFQVMEETPRRFCLVLPVAAPAADAELNDEELEMVAGGAGGPDAGTDCPTPKRW